MTQQRKITGLTTLFICVVLFQQTSNAQTTEGQRFVLAFPYRGVTGTTDVTFTSAYTDATVTVTGPGYYEAFIVPEGTTYTLVIQDDWYVGWSKGIEDKALLVESDAPIRLYYCRTELNSFINPDATQVFPLHQDGGSLYEYLLGGTYFTSSRDFGGYYMVAASDDVTIVDVYLQDGGQLLHHVTTELGSNQVYTEYMGAGGDTVGVVKANKPVAVFCGHYLAYIEHGLDETYSSQYLHEAMPEVGGLNTLYITVPIRYGMPVVGYVIRVVTYEDSTIVTIPELGVEDEMHYGNSSNYNLETAVGSDRSILIGCSKKCLVIQYTKEVKQHLEGSREMAMTMVTLTPVSAYSTSLVFSPPTMLETDGAVNATLALTLASNGSGDLFLNGNNLKDYEWESTADGGHSYLTVYIDSGTYTLYTDDSRSAFAAYLYAVKSYTRGVAINLGFNAVARIQTTDFVDITEAARETTERITTDGREITDMPSVPTTAIPEHRTTPVGTDATDSGDEPTTTMQGERTTRRDVQTSAQEMLSTTRPEQPIVIPKYEITLIGAFESDSGEDFSFDCGDRYSQEFESSANQQAIYLNNEIGDSICQDVNNDDMSVLMTRSTFVPNGNVGAARAVYLVSIASHVKFGEVHNCMDEVTEYLQDHKNWDPAVVPPLPECPEVVFPSEAFLAERIWWCVSLAEEVKQEELGNQDQPTNPHFWFSIRDDFSADSDLDIFCILDYDDLWSDMFYTSSIQLAVDVANGVICSEQEHRVELKVGTRSFFAQGSQGYIGGDFLIHALHNSADFEDLMNCASELFNTVKDHGYWGDPFLPPPGECPQLEFETEQLDKTGEEWDCPESAEVS